MKIRPWWIYPLHIWSKFYLNLFRNFKILNSVSVRKFGFKTFMFYGLDKSYIFSLRGSSLHWKQIHSRHKYCSPHHGVTFYHKNSFPYLLTEPTTLPSLTNPKICKSYVPADVSLETQSYSMKIKILGQWKSIKYLRQFFSILMANFMATVFSRSEFLSKYVGTIVTIILMVAIIFLYYTVIFRWSLKSQNRK